MLQSTLRKSQNNSRSPKLQNLPHSPSNLQAPGWDDSASEASLQHVRQPLRQLAVPEHLDWQARAHTHTCQWQKLLYGALHA